MPDLLDAYLAEERMKPFAWGKDNGDCLLFLAGWAERLRWPDAGLRWRGKYSDKDGALAILDESGGEVEAISSVVGDPQEGLIVRRGDLGVIALNDWFLGMICTGNKWAARGRKGGVVLWSQTPAFVWALGY